MTTKKHYAPELKTICGEHAAFTGTATPAEIKMRLAVKLNDIQAQRVDLEASEHRHYVMLYVMIVTIGVVMVGGATLLGYFTR